MRATGLAIARAVADKGAVVTIVARSKAEPEVKNSKYVNADVSTVKGCKDLVERLKGWRFDTVFATAGVVARPKLTRTDDGVEEDLQISYRALRPSSE